MDSLSDEATTSNNNSRRSAPNKRNDYHNYTSGPLSKSLHIMSDLDDVESLHVAVHEGRVKKFRHKISKKRQMDDVESLISTETKVKNRRRHKCRKISFKKAFNKTLADQMSNLSIQRTFLEKITEDNREPALPEIDDIDLFFTNVPSNIVLSKHEIPVSVIPDLIFTGEEFDIGISHIHSPYKFWFYLEQQTPKFIKLQEKMSVFYNEHEKTHKMLKVHIKKDRVAVLRSLYDWMRVVILDNIALQNQSVLEVSVFGVDYGKVYTANLQDLYFLSKDFAELPCQSYRGRLALISPYEALHWKYPSDIRELSRLTYNITLQAKLYAFEDEEQICHLVLYNAQNRLQYGSIQNMFAYLKCCKIYKPEEEVGQWPFLDELFPTFKMLESHEFPNFVELVDTNHTDQNLYMFGSARYLSEEYKKLKQYHCFVNPKAADRMADVDNENYLNELFVDEQE